ncbi:MAG: HlyD family type I secretion periplasmic adaptor subunit [Acetobacteraceae bacterium]|nr:HlyD family type I secretion periplasmic adaptor subunit [Acetobacteraceae bacterium]
MVLTKLMRLTQPSVRVEGPLRSREQLPASISAQELMEFQSPTAAVIARPAATGNHLTVWTIAASIISALVAMGVYPVDRVVSAPGKVVSAVPNIVVQPLETAIVRWVDVKEGQVVHAGDLLARLDPTFVAADATASENQVASLQAEVDRLESEAHNRPYVSDGNRASQLQALIFAQRQAERSSRLENYRQRIDSARAKVEQTNSDVESYTEQLRAAQTKEGMRRELERLQVGSKLNTLDAGAQRAEINRALQSAVAAHSAAKSDLEAVIAERDAYVQQKQAETAQQLADQGVKLADAREQWDKARLRRKLVDLRADRDAVVLNVAKLSVGSVVQSGDELMSLVPADAPLSVEASIPGRDAGFVQAGNPVVIKFDTFPYTNYGYAMGTVNTVSADSFSSPRHGRERPSRPNLEAEDAGGGATFYRTGISLGEMKLHNLPAAFHMTPGMPVTADIKVGKRTVLAYLLSRVMPALTEGLREP